MEKQQEKTHSGQRIFASEAEENEYWANASPQERLAETLRLKREIYGDAVDKPIEKVAFIRRLGDEE